MPRRQLQMGEPAPWFFCKSAVNPKFCFHSVAGRYVVLCFFGSAGDDYSRQLLTGLETIRYLFDDQTASFFGVTVDPQDETSQRTPDRPPGVRFFYDFDLAVSRLYGATDIQAPSLDQYKRCTVVLDERLRVLRVLEFGPDPVAHLQQLAQQVAALPKFGPAQAANVQAPILVVPRVFEPEFCQTLIRYYESRGGAESGFMRDVQGRTVEMVDYGHKRRRDEEITDEALRRACMIRIHDRLVPEIKKAFQFEATRIERYIVACYEAEVGGHFRAHRDNTTKGTAHRRFAVSLMLNSGDYEGGRLRFPEFGPYLYTAPPGGAVVFSCSLLHEATPVTRGKRYVFLPFLYDDAAARIREENLKFVAK